MTYSVYVCLYVCLCVCLFVTTVAYVSCAKTSEVALNRPTFRVGYAPGAQGCMY